MIVHLNGALIDAGEARISPFDRGFLFGDGVYEGLRATRGHVIGLGAHVERMREGLDTARIRGFDAGALGELSRALLGANDLTDAFLYWQVTRGAPRAGDPVRQRLPTNMTPTVFGYAAPLPALSAPGAPGPRAEPATRRVALRPDTRWSRGALKSISLLGGVLAAIEADEAGCDDAILIRDGIVAEATASNVVLWIDGRFVTPALDSAPILAGVTRRLLLEADPAIVERVVTVDELRRADEVMLIGTTTMVAAVTHVDGERVGERAGPGAGPAASRLLETLLRAIEADRGRGSRTLPA